MVVSSTSSEGESLQQTSSSFFVVQVHCSDSEPVYLKEGVTELFKLYFDELYKLGCDLGFQGFQSEWTDLPGKYDFTKRGGLFVVVTEGASTASGVVGCIALRPLSDSCSEVKRMFLRDSHRRRGLGQKLANTIIEHAWKEGYNEIKLDSLERLVGAVKLYEGLGFQRIPPYCECPEADHVCMNLFRHSGAEPN